MIEHQKIIVGRAQRRRKLKIIYPEEKTTSMNKYQEALAHFTMMLGMESKEQINNIEELVDKATPLKPKPNGETRYSCCNCGYEVLWYFNYCHKCGYKIDWSDRVE